MKNVYYFLLFVSISVVAFAATWDERFADVCKYDEFCKRLKNDDGTWRPLRPEILAILRTPEMRKELIAVGSRYGVDPAAIASAVASENSLNVQKNRHDVQDWVAKNLGITQIGDKHFSIGIGEIHEDAAMEAENYCAKLEKRDPRSMNEIIQELTDPLGSIRVAAMIIKEAQDTYRDNGFDISKNPGILATVYNLGVMVDRDENDKRVARHPRAEDAKKFGMPRVNFFGLFAEKNIDQIKLEIGLKAADKPVVETRKKESAPTAVKVTKKSTIPMENQLVAVSSIALSSDSPNCADYGYGDRDATIVNFAPNSGIIDRGETITELGRGLDCNSKIWKLLRSASGAVGWVSEDIATKSITLQLMPKSQCTDSANTKCSKSVEDAVEKYKISSESNTRVWLKPYSKSNNISFDKQDLDCFDEATIAAKNSTANTPSTAASISTTTKALLPKPLIAQKTDIDNMNKDDLTKLATNAYQVYQNELKRMSKDLGIPESDLDIPENNYAGVAEYYKNQMLEIKKCKNSIDAEMRNCNYVNLNISSAQLNTIKYNKKPSYEDPQNALKLLNAMNNKQGASGMMGVPYYGYGGFSRDAYGPTEFELKNISAKQIRDSLKACYSRINAAINKLPNKRVKPPVAISSLYYSYGPQTIYDVDYLNYISDNATDDELLNYNYSLLTTAKMCDARLNLFQADSDSMAANQDIYSCWQTPAVVTLSVNMQNFMKDFLKNSATDINLQNDIIYDTTINMVDTANLSNLYNLIDNRMKAVSSLQNIAKSPLVQATRTLPKAPENSYCPGRTAEFIEEMLKSNPCISHVYIPSHGVTMKLKDYSTKVIFRNFEQQDRYLVEYGDTVCK